MWTEEQDKGDGEIESEEWGMFCEPFLLYNMGLHLGSY